MAMKMSSSYYKAPKTTPVFLLLDVSSSMSQEHRIDDLNDAVETMLKTLARDEMPFMITVITFGAGVERFIKPCTAQEAEAQWRSMDASGMTPMGGALRMAKDMIEDNDIIKGRMYYPVVVLVSDGGPNDDWKSALANFIDTGRTAKCQRLAMGIGAGANMDVLRMFTRGMTDEAIYHASDAAGIMEFFKRVTRVSEEQARGKSSVHDGDTPHQDSPGAGETSDGARDTKKEAKEDEDNFDL